MLNFRDGFDELSELLKEGKLAIFTGAGISKDSGLPLWNELLEKLIEFCEKFQEALDAEDQFWDIIEEAKNQVNKDPLRLASVLRQKIIEADRKSGRNINDEFGSWFSTLMNGEPNEYHNYIVSTNYPYILTSNYDELFEAASRNLDFQLHYDSYSLDDASMFAGSIYQERSAIIHIHGKKRNIILEDFILTSEDYTRVRKKYPGFTIALQTIFLEYSILFVGYGSSDPHLEDFIEEMSYYFKFSSPKSKWLPKYFLLLKEDDANIILEKHKQNLKTEIIGVENYSEMKRLIEELSKEHPRKKG